MLTVAQGRSTVSGSGHAWVVRGDGSVTPLSAGQSFDGQAVR